MTPLQFINKIRRRLLKDLIRITFGELRIGILRFVGVKIGKDCEIYAVDFSTEPYLIEIGDNVSIANGTKLVTHDGSVELFKQEFPNMDLFGTIKIGNNVQIGINTLIMPNTIIGSNCVIGAGSVIRGVIPDNSVVMGNPAKVIMDVKILKSLILNSKNRLDIRNLTDQQKAKIIKKHFNLT